MQLPIQNMTKYSVRSAFILLVNSVSISCASKLSAEVYSNIANTRTPLGEVSQQLNNTTKATEAPTPPMGWNSWDNYGLDITEEEFKTQVDYVSDHLRSLGYTYMVIDAGWYAPHLSAVKKDPFSYDNQTRYPTSVDRYGRWIPAANRFPSAVNGSFKALADYVHSKGLKFGLHIQRGIPWSAIERNLPIKDTPYHSKDIANPADACSWWDATLGVDMSKPGAQEYYDSCYALYASWGVDFVKVDDMSRPYHADEITAVRLAIEKSRRPMVYSLSPGSTPIEARYHVQNNADMWRISDDFWDTWPQLKAQFGLASLWLRFAKAGHWPDLDMLPVGIVGTRDGNAGGARRSRFSPDELRTLMTLWCMFRSPLILGGDVTKLNQFENEIIANGTLIDIDQHSSNCREISSDSTTIIYSSQQPAKHESYLAFFNISDSSQRVSYKLDKEPDIDPVEARDVWSDRTSSIVARAISVEIPAHGTALFVLFSR
jgi:alpha-galactosidase